MSHLKTEYLSKTKGSRSSLALRDLFAIAKVSLIIVHFMKNKC